MDFTSALLCYYAVGGLVVIGLAVHKFYVSWKNDHEYKTVSMVETYL